MVRSVVHFDLPGLLRFKAAALRSYVKAPVLARKRPNYDSSKRKLMANPRIRFKKPAWYERSFGLFVLYFMWSKL